MSEAAIFHSASGSGHAVRCRALSDALLACGISSRLYSTPPATELMAGADVVVLDVDVEQRLTVLAGKRVVRIVDVAAPSLYGDLVICGSAGAQVDMFQGGTARVLAGPEYSLLRPEFGAERKITHIRSGVLDLRPIKFQWDVRALAIQMATAVVAITYGGMRAMEATCVGTPTVIFPRNEGEHMNARGLMTRGCAFVADESELEVMAGELIKMPTLAAQMSGFARGAVDGLGVRRAAQAIQELIG